MPHINLQQATTDSNAQLNTWLAGCTARGAAGHPTSHAQTHTYGTGYPGASTAIPATLMQADWNLLAGAWAGSPLQGFRKWTTNSFGGAPGVMDLCCSCNTCQGIRVRDFNGPGGFSVKPRTFVYHLLPVQVAPPSVIVTIRASSNFTDDSLRLDYKIDAAGTQMSGALDDKGMARVILPPGVAADACRFGFQGFSVGFMKLNQASLLPNGRYMITITSS